MDRGKKRAGRRSASRPDTCGADGSGHARPSATPYRSSGDCGGYSDDPGASPERSSTDLPGTAGCARPYRPVESATGSVDGIFETDPFGTGPARSPVPG